MGLMTYLCSLMHGDRVLVLKSSKEIER